MPVKFRLKPSVALIATTFMISTTPAYSAGFALIENSASGMGNAFAGAAAVAEDASTVWFNPAGMTYLAEELDGKSIVSQVGHVISARTKYTDKGSTNVANGSPISGEANIRSDVTSFVPNLYVVKPINEKITFGFGMNGPFGSKTKYDQDFVGRYHATITDLLSVNLNPSVSYKASDKLSVAGGVSAQYVKLKELSRATDTPGGDSQVTVTGDSVAFGFNLGLLYQPTTLTRLGVSYRSRIKHDVDGEIEFELNSSLAGLDDATKAGLGLNDRDVKSSVTLPDSISISIAHKATSKLELLADVSWTGWSTFDELRITEVDGATEVTNTPEQWEDVVRVSVGANYKYNDKLTLRTGLAFDEEPIPSPTLRTPRIPGNDRTWVSVGAGYKVNKHMSLDFGYSHLFLNDTPIDHTADGYNLRGVYESDVDILSAQLNYKF